MSRLATPRRKPKRPAAQGTSLGLSAQAKLTADIGWQAGAQSQPQSGWSQYLSVSAHASLSTTQADTAPEPADAISALHPPASAPFAINAATAATNAPTPQALTDAHTTGTDLPQSAGSPKTDGVEPLPSASDTLVLPVLHKQAKPPSPDDGATAPPQDGQAPAADLTQPEALAKPAAGQTPASSTQVGQSDPDKAKTPPPSPAEAAASTATAEEDAKKAGKEPKQTSPPAAADAASDEGGSAEVQAADAMQQAASASLGEGANGDARSAADGGEPAEAEPMPEEAAAGAEASLPPLEPSQALTGGLSPLRFESALDLATAPLLRVMRKPDGKANEDAVQAIQAAAGQYAQTVRQTKTAHEQAAATAAGSDQAIRQAYQQRSAQASQAGENAQAQLHWQTAQELAALERGTQTALGMVEQEYQIAASQLHNLANAGYSRLRANAKEAEAQKPTVLKKIQQQRAKPFDNNKARYQEEADKGSKSLQDWPQAFDKESAAQAKSKKDAAKNEAKKAQIKRLQPHKIRKIGTFLAAALAGEEQRKADNWKAEGPKYSEKIDERRNAILKDGVGAVSGSLQKALRALDKQADSARKTLDRMHQSGKGQLQAQSRAAESRSIQLGNSTQTALHGEAQAAGRTLAATQNTAMPMFARTANRLADTLTRAAEGGPAALNHAAKSAPKEIQRVSAQSAQFHAARLGQMQTGVTRGLAQRVIGMENTQAAQQQATAETLAAAVAKLSEQLSSAAVSGSRGFGNMAGSVAGAADKWLQPLAETFKQAIEGVQQKGDAKAQEPPPPAKDAKGKEKDEAPEDIKNLMGFASAAQKLGEAFKTVLDQAGETIITSLKNRADGLRSELNKGLFGPDVPATLKHLRGITGTQGGAIYELYNGSLSKDLGNLKAVDRLNADLYLQGKAKEAARMEVRDAVGIFTDDEQRIKDVMRELPPDAAAELAKDPDWAKTAEIVRDALDGSDLAIFNARFAGETDKADMLEMKEEIDAARENDDKDALNASLKKYATANEADVAGLDPEEREQMNAERRAKIQKEFAQLPGMADQAAKGASNADVLLAYATRTIVKPSYGGGEGPPPPPIELKVEGAQRDLAEALIKHGPNSVEARTATLAVEIQRPGGADPEKVDKATVDPRLNPNNYPPDFTVPPKVAEAANKDREAMLLRFAQQYGNANQAASVEAAKQFVSEQLKASLANQKPYVQEAAVQLLQDGHPSIKTAAQQMRFSIEGLGTNLPLIKTTLGRMSRAEIAQLRLEYWKQTGADLYADLGVFGHGILGDVSGADRQEVEVLLLGMPRTDKERAEVAEFSRQQQIKETGDFGKWLASGSAQEQDLHDAGEKLKKLTGAELSFGADGKPIWNPKEPAIFGKQGQYTGENSEEFRLAVQTAQNAAQNYAAKIDSYADAAVTAIAVIGAIAAAVATVLTGGAASPLLLAAIAGATGLASMGMHRWISGGRYGWEQASLDLGMTAVQMLTAGVGAQLGAASRGGMAAVKEAAAKGVALEMGKLTGNAVMDMVVIGAATGAISGMGQAALSEETWKKGFEHALAAMLEGTLKGTLSGAATAAASQAVEHLPTGGKLNLGSRMGQSTSMVGRGVMKAASNGVGAFAGRGAEIGFDVAGGKFKGDAGDALLQMAAAGGHAALQGFGEGAAEAPAQRIHNAKQKAAELSRPAKPTAVEAETPAKVAIAPAETPASPKTAPEAATTPKPAEPAAAAKTAPPETAEATAKTPVATAAEPQPAKPSAIEPTAVIIKPPAESAPTPVSHPSAAEAPAAVPPPARALHEGEAAHLPGSSFHASGGGKVDEPGIRSAIGEALPRLSNEPIHTENGKPVVTLKIEGKADVKIHIETELPPTDIKQSRTKPVASFHENPDGTFTVKVSAGAKPEHVERALAHELAEIKHLQSGGRDGSPALAPGSKATELTAHDMGRLAELEVINRQIAESAGHPDKQARLQAEAEALVSHLGLVHGGEAAQQRLALLEPALQNNPGLKAQIGEAIAGAKARNLPPAPLELRQTDDYTNAVSIDKIRQRFADRENFQEWGDFKAQYQSKHPESKLSKNEGDLFALWTRGRYVTEEGHIRSLLADEGRRAADIKAAKGEALPTTAQVDEATAARLLAERDAARQQRKGLLEQADQHEAKGNLLEADNLRQQADALQGKVNEPTRQLGEAATDAYIKARPDAAELAPVPLPKEGAGVPDKVYQTTDGRLVIIEAKGGGSPLGVREGVGASRGMLVEQGTRQYLESLVAHLTRKNAPDDQKALGNLIKEALKKPNGVEYLLVRQPIVAGGAGKTSVLGKMEVQAFDINGKPATPGEAGKAATPKPLKPTAATEAPGGQAGPAKPLPPESAPAPVKPTAAEAGGGTADQTAAGIAHSRMAGDAAQRLGLPESSLNKVLNAAEKISELPGVLQGQVKATETPDGATTFTLLGKGKPPPEIPVRFVLVDDLPRIKGEMPAARYDQDPDTPGGYVVKVSRGTPASELPRAVAHELAEIRAVHGTQGDQADALGAGGNAGKLSPHDEGRLAELDMMAGQIAKLDPGHPETPATRKRLLDEAQRLADHLGLLGGSQAAGKRLDITRKALPEGSPTRALLEEAVQTAADNPFLQKPTGKVEEDLALLSRRFEHARSLGEDAKTLAIREAEILDQAAKVVMRDRLVEVPRHTKNGHYEPAWNPTRIAELRSKLPPEQQALLDLAVAKAKKNPPYRADETRAPTPGYEARFLHEPTARTELDLPPALTLKVKYSADKKPVTETLTVEEAVARRRDLLGKRRAIDESLQDPKISDAEKQRLKNQAKQQDQQIRALSEALGTAAGLHFVANHPELSKGKVISFPREGAGMPDLVVEMPPHPGGPLALVECKGGTSELGTRESADKRLRVQQGRREYLESLAQEMANSKDPTIQQYGQQLRRQLDNQGQETRYFLVRQGFDIDENKTPPEVGEFDVR